MSDWWFCAAHPLFEHRYLLVGQGVRFGNDRDQVDLGM